MFSYIDLFCVIEAVKPLKITIDFVRKHRLSVFFLYLSPLLAFRSDAAFESFRDFARI